MKNDFLNLRSDHDLNAKIVAKIPPGTHGLRKLGTWPNWTSDAPPTDDMIADHKDNFSKQEIDLLKKINRGKASFWCQIQFKKIQGWVHCKFLAEDESAN